MRDDSELADNQIAVITTDNNCYVDLYSFVAPEAGTYTFILPAGLGFQSAEAQKRNKAPEVDIMNPATDSTATHTVTVELKANEKYEFYICAFEKGAEFIITYEFVPSED